MRKTTKTKKVKQDKKVVNINFTVNNPSLKEYFKTPEITAETLQTLRDLAKSKGWEVIQAYIKEQQEVIAHNLLKVSPADVNTITQLQVQANIREELYNLPTELINLITNTSTSKSFDPYK